MLSFELLHEIQEYIDKNYIEESLENCATPDIDIHYYEFQDASNIVGTSVHEEVGYNPENDFPVPDFLKAAPSLDITEEPEPVLNENAPKRRIGGFFSKLRDIPALEDLEEDDEAEGRMESICEPTFDLCIAEDLEDLKEKLSNVDEGFSQMLTKKIDALGMTDADCYHKAQLNRSHFNKIKNDPNYHVQKETVFALALALSLNRPETDEFLAKAGYAFSPSSKADLIIEYCINKGIYDVIEVNQLLYAFDQKLLGAGIRE